ncbi:MAG TPA: protease pro-enzyme activation domain-containing protein [Solirubrobacteraceae bacterium]|nr:protease pro-enzyme activation domain-containing protein [Solirubrobacteraceae bacterium]
MSHGELRCATAALAASLLGCSVAGALAGAAAAAGVHAAGAAGVHAAGAARVRAPDAQASAPRAPARHIAIVLRPRDPGALAAYALEVSTPGSPQYHRYLTPSQFARRFGAPAAAIAAVRGALRARGLGPGTVSAGGLSISLEATSAQLRRAFGQAAPAPQAAASSPQAAAAARAASRALGSAATVAIQQIIGLWPSPGPRPLLARTSRWGPLTPLAAASASPASSAPAPAATSAPPPPPAESPAPPSPSAGAGAPSPGGGSSSAGAPSPCAAAQQAAAAQHAYTADQIAGAYEFSDLYAAGDLGAGVTVAVYELESDDPADIAAYQACYGTHASISYVRVDGGAGSGAGSGEAALDIENLISLAPDAHVLVYQGPNSLSGNPGSGPYDTLSAIVNQDRARVITISWGQCEPTLGTADAQAENALFEQAAVQGQSVVAASGDDGSEDCLSSSGPFPQTAAAVDDPASQPFVTGVGGTTLSALGPPPTETAWNDAAAQSSAQQPGAGGGGISTLWPMPPAQADAAASLHVRSPLSSGSTCGDPAGLCREVPDVSADADPASGYLVYWNGSGSVAGSPAGWQAMGGTSGAAPVWAALLALADASARCSQSPVGYADPALYRAASADYTAYFNDVTSGDNDFTGATGGLYPAGPGYDMATGLGTPRAAALVGALCGYRVGLGNPGPQRSTLGARVSLRLHATDATGARVSYSESGLPPGLRLNPSDGVIAGRPTRRGSYTVRVIARDDERSAASVAFRWTVGARPTIRLLGRRARSWLSLVVSAGAGAPALARLAIALPLGLRLPGAGAVRVAAATGTRPSKAAYAVRGREVSVSLEPPARQLRLSLDVGSRALSPSLKSPAARGGSGGERLALSILDAAGGRIDLAAEMVVAP